MTTMRHGLAALALLLWPLATLAQEPPVLHVPVACEVGSDCFVQQFFDHDPGPGATDFTCGPLSYDGHDGTDIRARTLAQMEAGIPILAAAAGVVIATRNDMDDVDVSEIGLEAVAGRNAGNAVRIDHGNGWITMYSHMMKGSVAVRPGDTVAAGQQLGLMGLSGKTQFPHLEFSVQHEGIDIDPFVGKDPAFACDTQRRPLWTAQAQEALAYVPGAALAAGFAGGAADFKQAREGAYDGFALIPSGEALVFWAEFFGLQTGDRIVLLLELPGGGEPVQSADVIERDRAREFQFAGRKRPDGGWPSGTYIGRASLVRTVDGTAQVVSQIERELVLP